MFCFYLTSKNIQIINRDFGFFRIVYTSKILYIKH